MRLQQLCLRCESEFSVGVNWSAQCSDSQFPPSAQRWFHHALLELMWKWSGATARPGAAASVKSAAGEVCRAWVRLSPREGEHYAVWEV